MAKILVVDDQPFMLRYLEHLVARAGHKPIKARNRVEMAEALSKSEPAVVVVGMADGDLLSVTKTLSGTRGTKPIPVIILSGLANPSKTGDMDGFQPAAVFNKPFSPTRFVGTIERLAEEVA